MDVSKLNQENKVYSGSSLYGNRKNVVIIYDSVRNSLKGERQFIDLNRNQKPDQFEMQDHAQTHLVNSIGRNELTNKVDQHIIDVDQLWQQSHKDPKDRYTVNRFIEANKQLIQYIENNPDKNIVISKSVSPDVNIEELSRQELHCIMDGENPDKLWTETHPNGKTYQERLIEVISKKTEHSPEKLAEYYQSKLAIVEAMKNHQFTKLIDAAGNIGRYNIFSSIPEITTTGMLNEDGSVSYFTKNEAHTVNDMSTGHIYGVAIKENGKIVGIDWTDDGKADVNVTDQELNNSVLGKTKSELTNIIKDTKSLSDVNNITKLHNKNLFLQKYTKLKNVKQQIINLKATNSNYSSSVSPEQVDIVINRIKKSFMIPSNVTDIESYFNKIESDINTKFGDLNQAKKIVSEYLIKIPNDGLVNGERYVQYDLLNLKDNDNLSKPNVLDFVYSDSQGDLEGMKAYSAGTSYAKEGVSRAIKELQKQRQIQEQNKDPLKTN